ncbi:InlB B-repeat-containing protein [Paenibacillus luteus]|uniref:InlB B-repeat-containing protein n=1 Tax=Paenibacillus luteus TaxID=2545753 RepID=UPI00114428A3|nr:InlB B-repeat-containing protein [Paenibacillus luteus]
MIKRRFASLFIALLILLEVIHPASIFAAWNKPDYQVSKIMNAVTRGPDRFVAVGNSGALYYSLDNSGGQFSGSVVSGTSESLNDIIYASGKYVMVGGKGTILTWVPGQLLGVSTSNTSNHLASIAYGGGKYVATGQFGTVVTSSDGVTWTSQVLSGAGGSYMYGVTYGDKFVVVGQHGELWSSLDGVSWTKRISNTSNYLQAVTYGNGQYVAVGTAGTVVTSPDGVTWTVQTSGITQSLSSITYGNGRYVAVGFGGTMVTSSNGVSWKQSASGISDYLLDIQYGNNTFIVVGNNVNLVYENSTVTYAGNGNTGGTGPTDSGTYGMGASATVLGKGSLVKTGYTFTGWNTAVNGSGTSYAPGSTLTLDMANVTLYAQWTVSPTYTITYNGNGSTGGTVLTDSGAYETGAPVTVLGKGSLVRTGYTFAGWNTAANGSGTNYAAGAALTMGSANVTLYAKWTVTPTYTVTYNGNGSTGGTVLTDSGAYETGAPVTVLDKGSLVRTGYTFAGWNTAANGSGTNYAAGAALTMGSTNITLYAKWTVTPTYTVTYNGNGSAGGTVPSDSGAYETGTAATVLGNRGNLVKPGYTFAGWNTLATGLGTNYAAGAALTMGNANITLYAKWTLTPTYTVTYNGNGSTGGTVPLDSGAYETGTAATVLGNTGNLEKPGYTFAGWNTLVNGSGTNYAAGAALTMGNANITLYAKWTLTPTYTVTYNGNGSTGGTVPSDSGAYETGTAATVLGNTGNLVKPGYTFAGWNTLATGLGTNYAAGATLTMGSTNITLYAKWTLTPTYTVTYNGNGSTGGTVPSDSGAYETGTAATVLGNTGNLEKPGYTFAGWNTLATGLGTNYAAGATLTMGSTNITLYAKWTLTPTYTVTYNGNGSAGGTVPSDSGAYETGTAATVLGNTGNLVKPGYTFAGWNTLATGLGTNYAAGATLTMGSTNITLYAKWTLTPTYTVTYNGNGSTGGTVPSDSGAYETGTAATVLGNTGNLEKPGYTFAGWNTLVNGSGTNYAAGAALTMGNANITLYAKWTLTPTYTVTYNGNGSAGGTAPSDSGAYETGTAATVLGNKGNLVKSGYTFAGWNTLVNGSGTNYAEGATLTMGSTNITLYAKWTLTPTYTVTYNGNGSTTGTIPIDSGTYETGTAATILGNTGNLVKPGYTFAGWNTEANGSGTNYAAGATLTMGSTNVTLYAKWTLTPTYTVTYNGNGSAGGTAPSDSGAYETGTAATVLGNKGNLVKSGYTFAGWNTLVNGSGTNYAEGATLTMGSTNITLYAKWTLTPTYTVTYNGNGSTTGTIPIDSGTYETGTAATILGNTGNLVKPGYTFAGWNTEANGSGTNYAAGAVLTIGNTSITLFAQWRFIKSSGGPINIKLVSTDGKLTLPVGAIGEVSFENLVKIFIPSGAADKEIKITIKRELETEKLLLKEKHPVSGVFEVLKNISENFKKMITISFAFEPSKMKEDQRPGVFYYDEIKKTWVEVAGSKVTGNWISVEVNYFAKFTVLCVETVNGKAVPCGPVSSNPTPEFNDIHGHWAASYIKQGVSKGIVNGYPNGTFKPNAAVTRAEFVVMLMNALKPQTEKAVITFTDTEKIGPWAKDAVAQAVQAGIIKGFEDGSFRPNQAVTRSEIVVMISRMLNLKQDTNLATDFRDDPRIPYWAKGAVAALKNLGLIQGKGNNEFAPNDKTTRAEATTILVRMLEWNE